jgi:hypothetical protein
MSFAIWMTIPFAAASSPATGRKSAVPFTLPVLMFWAKIVLNAFITFARGSFFCSCSAPLVVNPTAMPPLLAEHVRHVHHGLAVRRGADLRRHRFQPDVGDGEDHDISPRGRLLHPAALADHAHLVPRALGACLDGLSDIAFSDDPDFLFHGSKAQAITSIEQCAVGRLSAPALPRAGLAAFSGVAIPRPLHYF